MAGDSQLNVSVDDKTATFGDGPFKSVSVGPAGIWFINDGGKIGWISNEIARSTLKCPVSVQYIDQPNDWHATASDIDAGPTGIVYAVVENRICSRTGINDSQPQGTGWKCTSMSAIRQVSCGIDGCFFLNGTEHIMYRPEKEEQKFQVFAAPDHVEDIDAGLNYELWVITKGNEVYQRIGTSAHSPTGSGWSRVHGVQLKTISIGFFGPVGIMVDQAVILKGNRQENETQMWLDQLCNDPDINHVQNLQPSVINYFAVHDGSFLKCRSILHEEVSTNEVFKSLKRGEFLATVYQRLHQTF